jgi:hypothetical protein
MTYKASWTNRVWGIVGLLVLFALMLFMFALAVAYVFADY